MLSPILSAKVQKVINEFINDPKPFWVTSETSSTAKINLRKIAGELNILPIDFDWFACWGIRPTGEIVFFQFEEPYQIKTEINQKILNMILFGAAKKYAALIELLPVRNQESIICPGCDGSGILKEFANHKFLANSVRCNCGGVGWLPSADEKYLYF